MLVGESEKCFVLPIKDIKTFKLVITIKTHFQRVLLYQMDGADIISE